MPRPYLGPRLWFDVREQLWYIRDGQRKRATGCTLDDRSGAERVLVEYVAEHYPGDAIPLAAPIIGRPPEQIRGRIYAVTTDDIPSYPIKIGFTESDEIWANRARAFQYSCPFELRVIASAPATLRDEQAIHARLRPHLMRHEWYPRVPDVLDVLRELERAARAVSASVPGARR